MGARENKFKRILNKSYKFDSNKIKISSANSYEHELIKSIISIILIEKKHEIVTEAIFETGGRADIFDLTTGIVYEVLHTESEEYFLNKKLTYPKEICEIVDIRTKDFKKLNYGEIRILIEDQIYF